LGTALWNGKKNYNKSAQKHAASQKVKVEVVVFSSQRFKSQLGPFALQSLFKHMNSHKDTSDLLMCIALFN